MVIYLLIETQKLALLGDNHYMNGVYLQILNHCPIFLESKPSMPIEKFVGSVSLSVYEASSLKPVDLR